MAYIGTEGPQDLAFLTKLLRLTDYEYAHTAIPEHLVRITEQRPKNPKAYPPPPLAYPHFLTKADMVVAIAYSQGGSVSDLVKMVRGHVYQIGPENLAAIGVVIDGDTGGKSLKRFAEFREETKDPENAVPSFRMPAKPGTVEVGPPKCGVFVLPDNESDGTLETVLLHGSRKVHPKATANAEGYVKEFATSPEFDAEKMAAIKRPAGPNKAALGILGNLVSPGSTLQVGIRDGEWVSAKTVDVAHIARVLQFLKELL